MDKYLWVQQEIDVFRYVSPVLCHLSFVFFQILCYLISIQSLFSKMAQTTPTSDKATLPTVYKHHCPQNSCITQHNLLAVWHKRGFLHFNVGLCFSAEHLPSVWVRCRGSFGWTRYFDHIPLTRRAGLWFSANKTDLRIKTSLCRNSTMPLKLCLWNLFINNTVR